MFSQRSTIDYEYSLQQIEAMLKQEQSGYTVQDYLNNLPTETPYGEPIDADARYAIADWCVKIMDACEYRHETAAIAMSYLDRFVSTPAGRKALLDRHEYQLAALAAMYTAVKIHEQQALAPSIVAKLSHGVHSTEAIEAMELQMLQALQWRVNPVTAMDFMRNFLDLIPPNNVMDEKARLVVAELAECQITASLAEYNFCIKRASLVAFAALLNSVESVLTDGIMNAYIQSLISRATDIQAQELNEVRDALYEIITYQTSNSPMPHAQAILRRPSHEGATVKSSVVAPKSNNFSPRSVYTANMP